MKPYWFESYEFDQELLAPQFLRKPIKRSDDESHRDDIEEDEILGSDDDEQESPKDYCKVNF